MSAKSFLSPPVPACWRWCQRPSITWEADAILNEIHGLNHDGTRPARVPALFGMNFQAVSVGEKFIERSLSPLVTGGYLDNQARRRPHCSTKSNSLILQSAK